MNADTHNSSFFKTPGFRTGLKIVVLIVLLLVLLIPIALVRAVVDERERRQSQTVETIIELQGGRQRLTGPFVAVPATVNYTDEKGDQRSRIEKIVVIPLRTDTVVTIDPEILNRGIYEIPVYEAQLRIDGTVRLPAAGEISFPGVETVHWDEAEIVLGIQGVSGLRTAPEVTINDVPMEVRSSDGTTGGIGTGIAAYVTEAEPEREYSFSFVFSLSGGGSFHVIPTAVRSSLAMRSSWASPSFTGDLLPTERNLSEDGFSAEWEMTALGMGLPNFWIDSAFHHNGVQSVGSGVEFLQPVDHYQQTSRSVKYAVLFLLLPFVALFLLEIFSGVRIHPVQYLLIAAAKIVFYLLLLSLSEQIAFIVAYWSGAAATIALVTFYVAAFLRRTSHALLLGAMVAAEYLFLFAVLRSEDYALLIGSLGLFVLLAVVMSVTRSIDWYRGDVATPRGREAAVKRVTRGDGRQSTGE